MIIMAFISHVNCLVHKMSANSVKCPEQFPKMILQIACFVPQTVQSPKIVIYYPIGQTDKQKKLTLERVGLANRDYFLVEKEEKKLNFYHQNLCCLIFCQSTNW